MSHVQAHALRSDDGNRIQLLARAFLALGLVLSLFAALVPPVAAQGVTVQVSDHPTLGKILTDGKGMVLYLFTKDTENVTNCYDQCAVNWPPLVVGEGEEPAAGEGLTGQLGTIDRTDGTRQVTYNGMPLYYWIDDANPGDATGQDVGRVWYVVHPDISSMTVSSPVVDLTAHPQLGNMLTNQGFTLYLFTNDTADVTNCYDQCAVNWPPLLAAGGEPVAGEGVTGRLGTIERTDGTRQVTYNGIPLYFWIRDVRPGDTTGQGVGDVWYVLDASTAPSAEGVIAAPAQASVGAAQVTVAPAPAAATPATTLPVTGSSTMPWPILIVLAAGGLLMLSGVRLALARRR